MHPKANELRFVTKNDGYVHVHPSSVNYTVRNRRPSPPFFRSAGVKAAIVATSGPPLQQPVPGLPREGEDQPRLHQGLQHGVGVPAGAVRRRPGQRGAPQGGVCHLSGRRLDPVCCCFSPGGTHQTHTHTRACFIIRTLNKIRLSQIWVIKFYELQSPFYTT